MMVLILRHGHQVFLLEFRKDKIMFTIQYVKKLQWCDAEHTMFSCNVKYYEFNEEHPSGINATDDYAHIKEIWAKANAEKYGVIAEYVPIAE